MSYAIAIGVGMSILTFVFAYLAININEYRFIRLFFLSMCSWTMTLTIGALREIADIDGLTILKGMMTTMETIMMSVSYLLFAIMFILGIMSAFNIMMGKDIDSDFDGYDKED